MSYENQQQSAVQVGVIGYGFMGRTHVSAYQRAQRDGYACKLFGVADSGLQSLSQSVHTQGNISANDQEQDLTDVQFFQDAQELIAHPEIDLISICTHTDTHVDLAIQALNAGKHVLVEKPVALDPASVKRLSAVANASSLVCVPAMCMRFWPAWERIRELIHSKAFGPVRSAAFHRLGCRPNWSVGFYEDQARSGGVLYDLQIHDTDFIVNCFGIPDEVMSMGDGMHLSTLYRYADKPVHVLAHAAWDHQPSVGFQMKCAIVFEDALIDFDINRESQLMSYQGDDATPIELNDLSGYDGEVRYVLDRITSNTDPKTTSIDDAVIVADVLEAQNHSLITKNPVAPQKGRSF